MNYASKRDVRRVNIVPPRALTWLANPDGFRRNEKLAGCELAFMSCKFKCAEFFMEPREKTFGRHDVRSKKFPPRVDCFDFAHIARYIT